MSVARIVSLVALAALLAGCHFVDFVTPKPGDYPCLRADSLYCGGRECCPRGTHCMPDRCDFDDYDGNKDWIGARKSVPREKAVQ